MVSIFLVFLSNFCSSSWCQLIIPNLYLSTRTASDPTAHILFFALNSMFKINFNLLKYSSFNSSFSFLHSLSWLSSIPKYLHAFLGSPVLQCPSQMCFLYLGSSGLLPFLKKILAHFSNPKVILMSLLIVFTIFVSFSKLSSLLRSNFRSSTHTASELLSFSSMYLIFTISSV